MTNNATVSDTQLLTAIRLWASANAGKDKAAAMSDVLSVLAQAIDDNLILMPKAAKLVTNALDDIAFSIDPEINSPESISESTAYLS